MRTVERDIDRILTALRNRIREQGFTQLEVQEALGWGRSYISQLLTKQKTLRIEQVLQILNVINVKPEAFWAELYQFGPFGDMPGGRRGRRPGHVTPAPAIDPAIHDDLGKTHLLLRAVVTVLKQKSLITSGEFDAATKRFRPSAP